MFFFLRSSGICRSYGWLSTSFSLRLTLFAEDDIPGGLLLFLFDTYLYYVSPPIAQVFSF